MIKTSKRPTKKLATKKKRPNASPVEIPSRLKVMKTYKVYIDGKFPRTESGRYFILKGKSGEPMANLCNCSRKDFRDAVVAARKAQAGWAGRSAFNKGQILYRIAEMIEGRRAQFIDELMLQGSSRTEAESEINVSTDRLLHYAGWSDKYQQIFSSVNPVDSPFFNFSMPEPTGVVTMVAPEKNSLIGLVSLIAPAIVGGNTCVVLASSAKPLSAITFSEVLHSSDVPAGVVNILTGFRSELLPHFSSHMDVNAIVYCGDQKEEIKTVQRNSSLNVKRCIIHTSIEWVKDSSQSPYLIMDTQEIKTTWHPVGM